LDDQNLSEWDEADNSNDFRLTEFNPGGTTFLNGGGTVLDLGTPVDITGGPLSASDFSFDFKLNTGQIIKGVVELGSLPTPADLVGDYNNDNVVDAADDVVWRKRSGAPQGYTDWKNNFGEALGGGSGGDDQGGNVPEPGVVSSALLLIACFALRRRTCAIVGER
jgi:hypothetical protein